MDHDSKIKKIKKMIKENQYLIDQLNNTRKLLKKTINYHNVAIIIQRNFKKWLYPRVNKIIVIQRQIRRHMETIKYRNKIYSIYVIQFIFRERLLKKIQSHSYHASKIQFYFRRHLHSTSYRERNLIISNSKLKRERNNLARINKKLIEHLKDSQDFIENQFECPISMKKISESKDLKLSRVDGRFYEKRSILRWLRNNPVSPFSRQPMEPSDLIPVNWLYSLYDKSKLGLPFPKWTIRVVDFLNIKNINSPWFQVPFFWNSKCQSNISIVVNDKGIGLRFTDFLKYKLETCGYLNLNISLITDTSKKKIHTQEWLKKKFSYLHDVNYYFCTREILFETNMILSDLFWILNKNILRRNIGGQLLFQLSFCHN